MATKTGKSKEYYNAMMECFYYQQMIQEMCNGDDAGYGRKEIVTLEDCILGAEMADGWQRYAMGHCL